MKSPEARRIRAVLLARAQLRRQSLDARDTIWSILQGEGMNPPGLASAAFDAMVQAAISDPDLALEPDQAERNRNGGSGAG